MGDRDMAATGDFSEGPGQRRRRTSSEQARTPATSLDEQLGTAAQHAAANVPVAAPDDTVDGLLSRLRGRRFGSASAVAVCKGDRLVGLATIERLLAAPPGALIRDIMDGQPLSVTPTLHQEKAAWQAVRHGEPGLAVVDETGRFIGLIPPQRLLGVLLAEHDEDMARLGGFLGSTAVARAASTERVTRRLWHRLPWLLLGLVGALLSALVVGAFQRQLEEQLLIALFIPGVVYIADAVGTQTEALVIRGLSVGVTIRRIAVRELITGALVGVILAGLALPAVLLGWGSLGVAAAVAIALLAASSLATLIAMALPWTISKLGRDPAYGSGPLATVIQDLVSIAIYFLVASALVG